MKNLKFTAVLLVIGMAFSATSATAQQSRRFQCGSCASAASLKQCMACSLDINPKWKKTKEWCQTNMPKCRGR